MRALLCLVVILTGCGRSTVYRFPSDAGVEDAGVQPEVDAGIPPCVPGMLTLKKATPAVMFVLDRSGSMSQAFGMASRWHSLTSALATALPTADMTMEIGALLFPSGATMESCSVNATANLMPALGHVAPLLQQMRSTSPGGATPTATALANAGTLMLGVRAASAAKALVLATDGAPNCNAALDPRTCSCVMGAGICTGARCLDDDRTETEIAGWLKSGLPTYVIGIQDEDNTELVGVLNAMAVAGGRPRVGQTQKYYAASSEEQIAQALVTIRDQVGGCVYLTTSVPDLSGAIDVTVNGVTLAYDEGGTTGWHWGNRSNGEIVIAGDSCEATAVLVEPKVVAQIECAGN